MLYDVIIIGGGPAGSSTATYLRQKSDLNVLVLEKENFPRDHVGESLIPLCYRNLKEMGVLDDVKKFATYKPGVNFVDNSGENQSIWCFRHVIPDEGHLSFHTLRAPFDNALLRNSEKHGANVTEGQAVKKVILDAPDAIVRVTTEDKHGEMHHYEARFLVDCSGQGTFLSKQLNSKKLFKGLDRTAFFCHWLNNEYDNALNEGLIKIIYLGGEKQGWLWVIPVGPNHLSIGVSVNNSYLREEKKKLQAESPDDWATRFYLKEISEATSLKPILKNARLEHEVLITGDYSYYNETKFGKNFAMVGDSGAFLDPIFSSGIFVAMEAANFVSSGIINGLKDPENMEKYLAETYKDIEGAYVLLEKFIRLFYEPDLMNFSHIGSNVNRQYEGFKNAYEVFHHLLAGDFFSKYKEYTDFIDMVKKEKHFKSYVNLVKSRNNTLQGISSCDHTFESIYGHLLK